MREKVSKEPRYFHWVALSPSLFASLLFPEKKKKKSRVLNQHVLEGARTHKFLNHSSPNERNNTVTMVLSPNLCSAPLTLTALDMAEIVGNPRVLIHFGGKKKKKR